MQPQRFHISSSDSNFLIRFSSKYTALAVIGEPSVFVDVVLYCLIQLYGVLLETFNSAHKSTIFSPVWYRTTASSLSDVEYFKVSLLSRVCFKIIRVTKQGNRQGRQQHESRGPSSHIWWQNGDYF